MADFIGTSLCRSVPYADFCLNTCGICWIHFRHDSTYIVRLPCGHIFHRLCCIKRMSSTAKNRNSFPECRTEFCLHNALSPEQEATRRISEVAYNEGMSPFNTEAYSWLLKQSDILYEKEETKEFDRPDFVSIIRDARILWQAKWKANEFICDEHAEVGNDWIELVAANRVRDKLTEDSLIDSWEGQTFAWVHAELMNLVNQGYGNGVSEAWEEFPRNDQGHEQVYAENAEDGDDFQQEQYDDYQEDEAMEDTENWDSEVNEEHSAFPDPESRADSMDGGLLRQTGETITDSIDPRLRVLVDHSPRVLAARTSTPQPSEPQQAMEETSSNRSSPSSVANSPDHNDDSSSSEEDELFPLPSAAEVARLPFLDHAVIQHELTELRSWIASENHIIVCEIGNVAEVVFRGGRTYDVKNSRRLMGFVRDADAYHMVGWIAIFYRFGEE